MVTKMGRTRDEANEMERAFNTEQAWRRGVTIALATSSLVFLLNREWVPGFGFGAAAFTVLARHVFRESRWLDWTTPIPVKTPLLVLLTAFFLGLLLMIIGDRIGHNGAEIAQLGQAIMVLTFVLALVVLMAWKEQPKDYVNGP